VSVALPAFLLGRDPTRRIVCVSYNQDLANFFGQQTRQVMQSPWYKRLHPSTMIPTRAAGNQFYTSAGGIAWRYRPVIRSPAEAETSSSYDDQIDAMSQALDYASQRGEKLIWRSYRT
jgi:hypothetical protein